MINSMLENIMEIMPDSVYTAPLMALLAGMLTSLMPCCLSAVPLVIGYVGGANTDTKKAFGLSFTFVLGSAVTFTTLGIIASMMGGLFGAHEELLHIVLGIILVLMALQTWGIIRIIPSTYLLSKNKKRSYVGAFLAGILGGIFSTPCSTPVLIALLAIVAGKGNVAWGVLLLLLYSAGHGFLSLAAGTSTGFAKKLAADKRYDKLSRIAKYLIGGVIMLAGFYMLHLGNHTH